MRVLSSPLLTANRAPSKSFNQFLKPLNPFPLKGLTCAASVCIWKSRDIPLKCCVIMSKAASAMVSFLCEKGYGVKVIFQEK